MTNASRYRLLLVEDNLADLELVKLLLDSSGVPLELQTAMDGEDAYLRLFGSGPSTVGALPDLILMDLNLPKRNGQSLLKEIKADPTLGRIPVVVLSTSNAETDVNDAYGLGASAFLTKPLDVNEFQDLITRLVSFYFGGVQLATRLGKTRYRY